jgi:phosphoserine phosphatase
VSRVDLVAFDVDGTLVVGPEGLTVWEVLNRRYLGTPDVNRERYARYRRGELSYEEWVALDVDGWRAAGATRAEIVDALGDLRLVPGARETVEALRRHGVRLAIISGTLDILVDTLWPDHPFDEVWTNRIEFDAEGRIAGWRATPYDMEGKARALGEIAARAGLDLARCAFVGDSSNDVWAARAAGLSIAWNPRSTELESVASAVVRADDLRAILPYLGSPATDDRGPARSGTAADRQDRSSPGRSGRGASRT